ncbi:MAG: 50S ribosomal protein L25 [Candidatus Paceibacterota bacterium]|jgi:large subunit ribosomal protein L25
MLTLNVVKRNTKDALKKLRSEGLMPAVFYGRKEKSTPIAIKLADFEKALKEAGESSVIQLKGEGVDAEALIQEVDLDPVKETPRHADFYVIEKGKKLEISVPIEFMGTSSAVKDLGGTLVKVLHELEIEALPKDLPHSIQVDISALINLDSKIHAKDIALPDGVILKSKPEEVVAAISEAVKEEEKPAEPIDIANIELSEKKGKEPKEGEEATPGAESKPSGDKGKGGK